MKQFRHNIIRAGLETLYFTGAHRVLRPILAGVGTILMLHNVRPGVDDPFQPNRHLEVTPDFLRVTLRHLRDNHIEIVTLDEMHRRLTEQDLARRFACITLDDGYRDNRDCALPVFEEFEAPFTVYVTSDFAEGRGRLWWITLQRLIAGRDRIEADIGTETFVFECATPVTKQATFERLHDLLRGLPDGPGLFDAMAALCRRYGMDDTKVSRELCLSWDELRSFAAHPLVTIGAHGVTHSLLAKQSDDVAAEEITQSRARIEQQLGREVAHLAYPYGDRSAAGSREFAIAKAAGFKTAVTTRPGMIFANNAAHIMALPRVSLNGNYQNDRLLPVLMSGAATAMWNGFRLFDAA